MRYAKIREMDISNGNEIGVSLFVQGCHFHCKGCFNPEAWDFMGGKEWNRKVEDNFMSLLAKPYIKRVSILGGEPLADENAETVLGIIQRIRREHPDKKIWLYTGYNWDEVTQPPYSGINLFRVAALYSVDFVIDGKFEIDKQDLFNRKNAWAGSTNQRIIEVSSKLYLCQLDSNERIGQNNDNI